LGDYEKELATKLKYFEDTFPKNTQDGDCIFGIEDNYRDTVKVLKLLTDSFQQLKSLIQFTHRV
jgi:hypothetical protein